MMAPRRRIGSSNLFLVFTLLINLANFFWLSKGGFVGVNYGTQFSTTILPTQVVDLLKRQSINNIRLYDADPAMLKALSRTGIEVMITLPNTQLLSVGESNVSATSWVQANVLPYLPFTNITSICVGTEVLTSYTNAALVLVPAMKFLHSALSSSNLTNNIKISTSHDPSLILDSFPPSQAYFNKTFGAPIIQPLLDFLSQTSSFFMLNIFSYDIYRSSNGIILLDYALLNPITPDNVVVDTNTLYQYRNLFDAVIDAVFFALVKMNHTDIPVVVSATGWPSSGEQDSDPDATLDNASTYNSNLIAHILNNPGTPKRRNVSVNTFLFELFVEDTRVGPSTDKNYGLFNASTMGPVYLLKLSNSGPLLANDTASKLYCVAKGGKDVEDALQIALDWACGVGRANCSAIQPGQLCYEPDNVRAHASFAFDSFYQNNGRSQGSCDFNGLATISTTNPSVGTCIFPESANIVYNMSVNGSGNGVNGNSSVVYDGNSNSATYANHTTSLLQHLYLHMLLILYSILALFVC